MKKTICLFAFVIICTFSFGQSNDLQAQYIYSKAEDNYAKNQFADAINQCEQAAEKLGQTNQKILFLELESYAGLLTQKCGDPLFDNPRKIDSYLDLYLNKLSNDADNEKIITIMKFKDQWADYKTNGCPAPTYADLHLGLKFRDSDYPEMFGKNMVKFWEVTEINNELLKNITGTATTFSSNFYNGKIKDKDVKSQDFTVGFLVDDITLFFPFSPSTGIELKSYGQPYGNQVIVSSTDIESTVNTWLKKETAAKHVSDKIRIDLSGKYPNDKNTSTLYLGDIPLHN